MTSIKQTQNSLHFCVKCNKSYKGEKTLLNHYSLMHSGKREIKLHKCSKWDNIYAKSGILSNHMKSHDSSSIYKCPQCQKVLSSKGHLNKHLQSIHKISIRQILKCYFRPSISQTYYSNSDLFNHMRAVHLKELPYKCQKKLH